MIKRGILERLGTLLLAVSFLGTAGADAWGLHECPHHDLGVPTAQAGASEAGAGGSHAEHGASHAESEGSHEKGTHDDHGPCTCVGHCQTGAGDGAALVVAPAGHALAHSRPDQALPVAALDESLPGAPPFLLPFANAPPRIS